MHQYEVRQSVGNPYYGRRRNNKTPDSVSQYVQRWLKWVKSGLDDYALDRVIAFLANQNKEIRNNELYATKSKVIQDGDQKGLRPGICGM